MIINSVTVENFRSFYGEQTINLSTDKDRNTTIIYAMNGVGKTNFLNAILWCLHGEFTAGFTAQDDVLNWEAEKRGRKSYHVTINFEEDGYEYIVKRSGGNIDSFKVFRIDDGNSVEISNEPSLFINSIIPKDMAGYFISDGEGSDLAVDSNGFISVRRSVRDILGFNIAEKTIQDLVKIKSEVRGEIKKFDKDKELADLEDNIQTLDERISEYQKILSGNRSALEEYEINKRQIDTQLGSSSSDAVKQLQLDRKRLTKELEEEESILKSHENKKILLIRQYSWAAFAQKLTKEAIDFIDESELKGTIPAPYNLQLVKDILERTECICGACINPGTEAYANINKLLATAADPLLLNRLQKARSRLTSVKTLYPQAKGMLDDNFINCQRSRDRIQSLEEQISKCSDKIRDMDDEAINTLEHNRKKLEVKIAETNRTIARAENNIELSTKSKISLSAEASRIEGLSPRAKVLKNKLTLIEEVEKRILFELSNAEISIYQKLKDKINLFLDKYLTQDYKVAMTSDFRIGLEERNGKPVPVSGGEGAILSFIFISSLISIAREIKNTKSNILTPGAIAPLIFDAPFSKLDASYAPNVAKALPALVDQLVIFMYKDDGKNIADTIQKEGRLGRVYYFTQESAAHQGDKEVVNYMINEQKIAATVYGAAIDKVVIKEAVIND